MLSCPFTFFIPQELPTVFGVIHFLPLSTQKLSKTVPTLIFGISKWTKMSSQVLSFAGKLKFYLPKPRPSYVKINLTTACLKVPFDIPT